MRKPIIRAMGASLLAGSMALSFSATATEGLYSMDELLDADVLDNTGEEIGEVEDVLLSDDMSVHSLVIRTGDILGLGGRQVVAERGSFTVQTMREEGDEARFDDFDYKVHMETAGEGVKELPEYDENWWNETRENLNQAWEETKDVSESAWENTKQATSSAWYNLTGEGKDATNN
ncbi:PRC-barrel domain-containing protein [Marinobacter daqiaonensis]|uniref:PRC-barrel domain-containing protein n=1 Tax=Marinobacter daqiaonensis TaxID=650891 RepID=A0A1I6ID00_9GAMM|nr:PRC-barrel domain-containing protein [Marinobacter daqiaonensis]SFR64573.1 PRC-barrel domain-containing protein [Marinobacter daqiaonensis]